MQYFSCYARNAVLAATLPLQNRYENWPSFNKLTNQICMRPKELIKSLLLVKKTCNYVDFVTEVEF